MLRGFVACPTEQMRMLSPAPPSGGWKWAAVLRRLRTGSISSNGGRRGQGSTGRRGEEQQPAFLFADDLWPFLATCLTMTHLTTTRDTHTHTHRAQLVPDRKWHLPRNSTCSFSWFHHNHFPLKCACTHTLHIHTARREKHEISSPQTPSFNLSTSW